MGFGWISDGVFGTGTDIELTKVWSALAFYEHIWNPHWRTAWGGGYVNVDYNGAATNLINASMPAGSVCIRGVGGAVGAFANVTPLAGNSCSPDFSFWEAYMRTQWNPVAQLDIGLEVMYTHNNTAYQGRGDSAGQRFAAGGLRGRRPERLVRDGAMAAQLLSMIG